MAARDISLAQAQGALREAYAGGGPGVLVSGLAWLAAGLAGLAWTDRAAFLTLVVGGQLIMPVSVLIARQIFKAPKLARGNPMERLAVESTFILFVGLGLGYFFYIHSPALALPVVAAVMGSRYLVFQTVYGDALYWVLAGAIVVLALAFLFLGSPLATNVALGVAAVEIVAAAILILRHQRRGRGTG